MAKSAPNPIPLSDPTEEPKDTMQEITHLISRLLGIYSRHYHELVPNELLQYTHGLELFTKVFFEHTRDPSKILKLQNQFWQEYVAIIEDLSNCTSVENLTQASDTEPDPRFRNSMWQTNLYFNFLRRQYTIVTRYTKRLLHTMDDLDHKTKQQLHFYTNNILNFLAPNNYAWSNPDVMLAIMESNGSNLLRGFKNYLEDLVLNHGKLNIRMTDLKAFTVGKNLAVTPGKVIFQNDLMQLIQYSATTPQVNRTPILFVPPWINKYYILDLSPQNSLVRWLVSQGFTVYMISWVNPEPKHGNKEFADYMMEGPIQAINVITETANCDSVNLVGYCIGGTLLAATLAYMQQNNDLRAKSATFFMSLLNFSNPGELGVFLDEPQIDALEKLMERYGFLNGRLLDIAFNTLRPNELIWPYFIHNYLLGKSSKPFDVLYWNADSSNLPYKMYIFYLRNMYLKNLLRKPGGIVLNDTPIDLGAVTTPAFFLSSETDHITLWRSVYSGLRLFNGPIDFVLSESGHVRGVINPPSDHKYGYLINEKYNKAEPFPKKSTDWLNTALKHEGSWWPYWVNWLISMAPEKVEAREIPQDMIIEDAPGSYVMRRI